MTIPEAESHLPQSQDLMDVFSMVENTHFTIGKTPEAILKAPFEKVAHATADIVTTSVAYFANRGHSDYAQAIGTNTWKLINRKIVLPIYINDIAEVLMSSLHMSKREVSKILVPGEPVFLVDEAGDRRSINGIYILFSPEFPARAINRPIEALATMAFLSSQANDIANNRWVIDQPNIRVRAEAFESDFLLFALSKMPDLQLSGIFMKTLEQYPRGLNSLPKNVRYTPTIVR